MLLAHDQPASAGRHEHVPGIWYCVVFVSNSFLIVGKASVVQGVTSQVYVRMTGIGSFFCSAHVTCYAGDPMKSCELRGRLNCCKD